MARRRATRCASGILAQVAVCLSVADSESPALVPERIRGSLPKLERVVSGRACLQEVRKPQGHETRTLLPSRNMATAARERKQLYFGTILIALSSLRGFAGSVRGSLREKTVSRERRSTVFRHDPYCTRSLRGIGFILRRTGVFRIFRPQAPVLKNFVEKEI